jgi:hypothetical protein
MKGQNPTMKPRTLVQITARSYVVAAIVTLKIVIHNTIHNTDTFDEIRNNNTPKD